MKSQHSNILPGLFLPRMVLKIVLDPILFLCILLPCSTSQERDGIRWDSSGYIMYCPCMGRLGNQAEQFLGALRFAKELNRTMVVPPWIAYDRLAGTSFTPYDAWFDFDELKRFHRVILMHDFVEKLAPKHWPDDGKSRKVYCPSAAAERSPDLKSCPAKTGNPFGPFWDSFGIDFNGGSGLFPSGLSYNSRRMVWDTAFPSEHNPVLAFMGAPGSFPVAEKNRGLQKYMKWSKSILSMAEEFIEQNLKRPFIGIHLRNGVDWVRACEHIDGHYNHQFMGSQQCVGYNHGSARQLTHEMCLPPKDMVIKKVKEIAKLHNMTQLFVATDSDAMEAEFRRIPMKVARYHTDYPVIDLALLTMADVFIGNCISTFTSFVIRQREVERKSSYFFAFDHEHPKILHEDL